MSSSTADLLTAAILTVSDSTAHGMRQDASGPALASLLMQNCYQVIETAVVADEQPEIQAALIRLSGAARLVVTKGNSVMAAAPAMANEEFFRNCRRETLEGEFD